MTQSVTGGVYGDYQQVFGTALSWYPNDWVPLMLQFQVTNVDKLNSAFEISGHLPAICAASTIPAN